MTSVERLSQCDAAKVNGGAEKLSSQDTRSRPVLEIAEGQDAVLEEEAGDEGVELSKMVRTLEESRLRGLVALVALMLVVKSYCLFRS